MTGVETCALPIFEDVYNEDYYISLLPEGEPETPQEIISYWNRFWMNLPDSGAIRRGPFFKVCDIAECMYDEQFYEEDE